jgi:hypothetical protein
MSSNFILLFINESLAREGYVTMRATTKPGVSVREKKKVATSVYRPIIQQLAVVASRATEF